MVHAYHLTFIATDPQNWHMMSTDKPASLQALMPEEQEAVITARLAVSDRPLRNLMMRLQMIVKSEKEEERMNAIASFTLELESFILNLSRLESVAQQTTVEEVRKYKEQIEMILSEHQITLGSIESLKRELVDVQQDRKNKLEYDSIANEIMKYGSREELETSLAKLQDQIDTLQSESVKYTEIMSNSESRFEGIASQLEALRAEVGFEVGERERRAVERGVEGEEEEDSNLQNKHADSNEAGGTGMNEEDEGGMSMNKTNSTSLNPAAAPFKPSGKRASRSSSPFVSSSNKRANTAGDGEAGKRTRSSARRMEDSVDEEQSRKKSHLEEGEMSDAEDEEEEGAA